ncbi:hypothetical protein [Methanosarcina mazei]|uniref:Uncharacterized protein n=1 Tax=Methanosarcina mazei TaxID=2209 RepID=A0A0F8Q3X5_METMZ|nr:hypothetical protein [Methanosarcina mazei]KKH38980.1 hypothetical protein DU71_01350 [Methanosarcina mazei]KKH43584.1 hypothetical protein DU72_00020 [Methanosarcina mazei]QIB91269.1 hypothetical protein FQU78_09660 [Methanosarcina mazei]
MEQLFDSSNVRKRTAKMAYFEIDTEQAVAEQAGKKVIFALYKDTRVGATTSMTAVSIDAHEKLIAIEPTNKIAQDTLVENTVKYSDRPDAKILQLPSNKHCIHIQQRIEKTPVLNAVPVFLRPEYCLGCEHSNVCPLMEIFRVNYDGVVLTYDKLAYMVTGSDIFDSMSQLQFNELFGGSEKLNIIFDEASWLAGIQTQKLQLFSYNKTDDGRQFFDFDYYINNIKNRKASKNSNKLKYNTIMTLVTRCKEIFKSNAISEKAETALQKAKSKRYWDEHISEPLNNPCLDAHDINDGDSYELMKGFFEEIVTMVENNDFGDKELTPAIIKNEILPLYAIAAIATAQTLTLTADISKNGNGIGINVLAPDTFKHLMISQFIEKMLERGNVRIIVTSATLPDFEKHNTTKYWLPEGVKIHSLNFDTGMNLNKKMKILTFGRRYDGIGGQTVENRLTKEVEYFAFIIRIYGARNVKIVVRNIKLFNEIASLFRTIGIKIADRDNIDGVEITYYRASDTVGVWSDRRVMIAVGFSHTPANSRDGQTTTRKESKEVNMESCQDSFWQTISRCKDEQGIEESLVFAFGMSKNEAECAVTWGAKRKVTKLETRNGQANKYEVVSNQSWDKPSIVDCKTFDKMIIEALIWKKPECNNDFPGFLSHCLSDLADSFLMPSFPTKPYYAMVHIGQYFQDNKVMGNSFLDSISTERKKENLLYNEKLCTITTDGMAKWVIFEKLDYESEIKLIKFFSLTNIPYMLEKDGEVYNIWIFLEPVKAKIAKKFGELIIRFLNIDCELKPSKVNIHTRQQENITILGSKSAFFVNGQWTRDIEHINITKCIIGKEFVDALGKYFEPEKEKEKAFDEIAYENKVKEAILSGRLNHFYSELERKSMLEEIASREKERQEI